jgi:hypothetical protein
MVILAAKFPNSFVHMIKPRLQCPEHHAAFTVSDDVYLLWISPPWYFLQKIPDQWPLSCFIYFDVI